MLPGCLVTRGFKVVTEEGMPALDILMAMLVVGATRDAVAEIRVHQLRDGETPAVRNVHRRQTFTLGTTDYFLIISM